MQTEQNKAVARRFIEEVLGKGDFAVFAEITAENYRDHTLPPGLTPQQSLAAFRAGFPDVKVSVEDVIAEDDKAVVRWTVRATNTGSFFGMPPTGRSATMTGLSMYRIEEGKLVEGWVEYDQLGLMRQIGAIPEPAMS